MKRTKSTFLALVLLSPIAANADLIGVTVTTTANIPLEWYVDTVVVGAGIELAHGDGSNHSLPTWPGGFPHLFSPGDFYDFAGSSITINFAALGNLGFPYLFTSTFSGMNWDEAGTTLQSVTIAAGATGLTGSFISSITNDGFVFRGNVDLVNGVNFTLDLTHLHPGPGPDPDPTPVPEPGTLALLGIGLFGMGLSRRRKKV